MKSSLILGIYLMLALFKSNESYVDLFLDSQETKTLLGLAGNLFYVYGGEIRQSSISYVIEIPYFKDKIEFNWKTSGFNQRSLVKYKFNLTNHKNLTNQLNKLSIESSGQVPNYLSKFYVQVNCTNNITDFEFEINVNFELNNTLQNDLQQLFTIPPLNFTIKYRKNCLKIPLRLKTLKHSSSNFTVAYIIIGALLGFAFLIASSAIVMFFKNKIKHRKLHSKYESLHAKLDKEKQLNKTTELSNKPSSDEDFQKQSEQSKNKLYTKNVQVNKNKNFYISKKARQLDTIANSDNPEINEETQNIYESVQEASINVTTNPNVDVTADDQSMLTINPRKSRNLLNITTNTIQSCYTTANTISTTNLLNSKPSNANFTKNSIDMCTKFKRDQIEFDNIYLEGTFSRVYEGKLFINEIDDDFQTETKESTYDNFDTSNMHKSKSNRRLSKCFNIDKEKGYMRVLIKTVNDNASLEQIDLMLKESCVMRGLRHKNLNPIVGICIEPDKHTLAIFPYNEMGNLKLYLNTLRQAKNAKHAENSMITTQEILYIILQTLKALNYLHGKRIIHKDIATRNCWLDCNFSLKLADCALSRDLFPQDYHCLANNENKPVFWMAYESLKENTYTAKTDVWSAGVFMWECFSLGAQPYEDLDPFDLITYLSESDQNRLGRPTKCPNEIFEIYFQCWNISSNMRPTLKEIFYSIHKLYSNYDNYV